MRFRTILIFVVLLAALAATAVLTGRPGDSETALGGFRAFRGFLDALDVENSNGANPPESGTFFLRNDFRNRADVRRLLQWVLSGGRVVLTDPGSDIASRLGLSSQGISGITSPKLASPGCSAPETAGVNHISAARGEFRLTSVSPEAVSCFHEGRNAYLLEMVHGNGKVVLLGGPSALTNEHLKEADNAMFAHQLVAGGPVIFGPPLPIGAEPRSGLWGLLPVAAKLVVVQLAVVLLAVMFLRGRRLGKPRLEEPLTSIPSGELVTAHGRLLRGARDASFAGRLLRDGALRRISRRVGLPSQTMKSPEEIARLIRKDKLKKLMSGTHPNSDEELLALARDLEEEVRALEGTRR